MPWAETTRRHHDRRGLRYASDCTDAEWEIVAPFLERCRKVGRPSVHDPREIWNAVQYVAASGCQWRLLPRDFPPFTTVQYHFYRWRDCGLLALINETLVAASRLVEGREAEPTAAIIDSQWSALDPSIMGLGPVLSATELLKRNELSLQDVETWELNEAFATQVLGCLAAWNDEKFCKEILGLDGAAGELDQSKLNVDGGAVSLGHPVGCSGNRIVLHLVNAMKRLGTRRGIATECIGGGQGGAMLIEVV